MSLRMINKKSIYVYIAATLAMLIPAPGRFACGIILVLELNVLMLIGTLLNDFINKLELQQVGTVMLLSMLIAVTMLIRQIIAFAIPEMAIQLGFILYLPTVSSFFIGYMFGDSYSSLRNALAKNMKHSFLYSIFALAFFLLRDIAGFGTITLLTSHGIQEIVLYNSGKINALVFFATIPGALVCTAGILILYVYVINKFEVVRNAELIND
jgi:hypothetical protein